MRPVRKFYLTGDIGSGIAPGILSKIEKERFRAAFINKGPFSGLLSKIPVHVMVKPDIALFHEFKQFETGWEDEECCLTAIRM
jgi:hypothetical protein